MTRRKALGVLGGTLLAPAAEAFGSGQHPAAQALQLLRVECPHWQSTTGTLTLWRRAQPVDAWQRDGRAIPVLLGRNGMRWGLGLHQNPPGAALKREGDGCAPAGMFALDTAFGSLSAAQAALPAWPWQQMTTSHAGVDDPKSRHYNRIVDASQVKRDWTSAENMMPAGGSYKLGLVVRHNWQQRPGGGSCIFLHIRQGRNVPTAGCTAMTEAAMLRILRWLHPAARPILAQLPTAEWKSFGPAWGFPVS